MPTAMHRAMPRALPNAMQRRGEERRGEQRRGLRAESGHLSRGIGLSNAREEMHI
jgi:hypothetical protein